MAPLEQNTHRVYVEDRRADSVWSKEAVLDVSIVRDVSLQIKPTNYEEFVGSGILTDNIIEL